MGDRWLMATALACGTGCAVLYAWADHTGTARREAKWSAECASVGMHLVKGECRPRVVVPCASASAKVTP